jgi:hypothetical protein
MRHGRVATQTEAQIGRSPLAWGGSGGAGRRRKSPSRGEIPRCLRDDDEEQWWRRDAVPQQIRHPQAPGRV